MPDINFQHIAPRGGSQSDAFEELCAQLARLSSPAHATFQRFRGAGGDGGVECIATVDPSTMIGWQAKYVFDIDALISQLHDSLTTALAIHPTLTRYITCFPFDLTGTTGRKTRAGRPAQSETDKFDRWRAQEIADALAMGRSLTIDAWPASSLRSHLLTHDPSGGIRRYFFDTLILSDAWFRDHLESAFATAGPRYTPHLNVTTPLVAWVGALANDPGWYNKAKALLGTCERARSTLASRLGGLRPDPAIPSWPSALLDEGSKALASSDAAIAAFASLASAPSKDRLETASTLLDNAISELSHLDDSLSSDFDATHGPGRSHSIRFREFMAEYNISFPAANIDAVRDCIKYLDEGRTWLTEPEGLLASQHAVLLTGVGGSGKTHGLCDIAATRLAHGQYTCIVFGHQFSGSPTAWTRMAEALGLGLATSKDYILDALNACGEASGSPLLLFIDGINESRPRQYWLNVFGPLEREFAKRPFLRLCVSCRTSFLPTCVPDDNRLAVVEHPGFEGIEREACNAFFSHYGLIPPLNSSSLAA